MLSSSAFAADLGSAPPIPATPPSTAAVYSAKTYPQIVRVSLVEGDVRVARGEEGKKADGAVWEKAVVNLPIEDNFVMGNGRAEIELEDASTLYLGDNSVLVFNEVTTTTGVPRTDVTLLSGTASVNLQTTMPGEWFILRVPQDDLSMRYSDHGLQIAALLEVTQSQR